MPDNPLEDLSRFTSAQEAVYKTALSELQNGRKRSHWMWYIFPQIAGLGFSEMSRRYVIRDLEEARRYLAHPILGLRLRECAATVMAVDGRSALDIFGSPDDMKLKSSMTLFAQVDTQDSVFGRVLDKLFSGERDDATLRQLDLSPRTCQ